MKNIINAEDIKKCGLFCKQIVEKENQYNRINEPKELRMFRTYMGKLGELYIDKLRYYLINNSLEGFEYMQGMFDIYEGKENADDADFFLNNLKVDVKTIYANDHRNIVVPKDQPLKDIYICSKIITSKNWNSNNFNMKKDNNWRQNIHDIARDIIDYDCVGFILRNEVVKQPVKNFGNDAYFVNLNNLDNDENKKNAILKSLKSVDEKKKINILKK